LGTSVGAGILVAAPFVVTCLILRLIYSLLVSFVDPLAGLFIFRDLPDLAIVWISLGVLAVLLYVMGVLATKVLGGRVVFKCHDLMETIPVVRAIYGITRKATEMLSGTDNQTTFSRVVFVDFPRKGMGTIGLVTGHLENDDGRAMLMLYIPSAPNPTSGFTALVFGEEVTPTDLSVEDAMILITSAGTAFPKRFRESASQSLAKQAG
jgi:uncharacterized membrane protein